MWETKYCAVAEQFSDFKVPVPKDMRKELAIKNAVYPIADDILFNDKTIWAIALDDSVDLITACEEILPSIVALVNNVNDELKIEVAFTEKEAKLIFNFVNTLLLNFGSAASMKALLLEMIAAFGTASPIPGSAAVAAVVAPFVLKLPACRLALAYTVFSVGSTYVDDVVEKTDNLAQTVTKAVLKRIICDLNVTPYGSVKDFAFHILKELNPF